MEDKIFNLLKIQIMGALILTLILLLAFINIIFMLVGFGISFSDAFALLGSIGFLLFVAVIYSFYSILKYNKMKRLK